MKKILACCFAVVTLYSFSGIAGAYSLPDPVGNSMLYGDFYSYSLPILAYNYDQLYGGGVGPGNPYYIASSPGQIADYIVVATGASGGPVNTNFAGMDDAYPTPNSSGITTFSTGTTADPGGAGEFTGDAAATWDSTLTSFVGAVGYSPIFYFNNNQTNSGSAEDQTLFAWGQMTLIDSAGILPNLYFDFTSIDQNNDGRLVDGTAATNPYNWSSPGAANGTYPLAGDYALSGGQVLFDGQLFNHNLGANQAAYAIYSPELNDILQSADFSGYDVMSIDFRMYALNNGYEQLFILPGDYRPPTIPEPATILLVGFGLAGIGLARITRRRS